MHLGNRSGSERFNREVIKPGFYRQAAHGLLNLLFGLQTVKGRDAILQHGQLIGNVRRKQVATGREHLTKLDPHRPQFL